MDKRYLCQLEPDRVNLYASYSSMLSYIKKVAESSPKQPPIRIK